jgi:hypothetical protein
MSSGADGQPAPVAFGQALEPRAAVLFRRVVPGQGARHRTGRARQQHANQVEVAPGDDEAREGHDHLGRNWRENVFQGHQREHAEVAAFFQEASNELEHRTLQAGTGTGIIYRRSRWPAYDGFPPRALAL